MCSRSGRSKRRPVSLRRTIAATTSNIGRVITTAGAVIASVAEVFSVPCMPSMPTVSPMTMLPESPRKMLAGGRL